MQASVQGKKYFLTQRIYALELLRALIFDIVPLRQTLNPRG